MALTKFGFAGTMSEARWADLHACMADNACTGMAPGTGGALQTEIAAGALVGSGILVKSSAVETVTHDSQTLQSRIDMVVCEIGWTGSGTADIVIVKGERAANPTRPALTNNPGTKWQVPLAKVTVTGAARVVEDARPNLGTKVVSRSNKLYRGTLAPNEDMLSTQETPKTIGTITVPDQGGDYRMRIWAQERFSTADSGGFGKLLISIDGTVVADGRAPAENKGVAVVYFISGIRSDKSIVRVQMLPQGMSGEHLHTEEAYAQFTVEAEPAG